jgi:hypothetical protein
LQWRLRKRLILGLVAWIVAIWLICHGCTFILKEDAASVPEHSDSRPVATLPARFVPDGLIRPSVRLGASA